MDIAGNEKMQNNCRSKVLTTKDQLIQRATNLKVVRLRRTNKS